MFDPRGKVRSFADQNRDNQHTSSDPANHYTGIELSEVADDEKGPFNGKATHFPTKK